VLSRSAKSKAHDPIHKMAWIVRYRLTNHARLHVRDEPEPECVG